MDEHFQPVSAVRTDRGGVALPGPGGGAEPEQCPTPRVRWEAGDCACPGVGKGGSAGATGVGGVESVSVPRLGKGVLLVAPGVGGEGLAPAHPSSPGETGDLCLPPHLPKVFSGSL